MKYSVVMTTTDKVSVAKKIAHALVEKRLAACVQAYPIWSVYSWKGKTARAKEFVLMIKSRSSDYQKIEKEIIRLHDYETPEILQIPVSKGSKGYLSWIDHSTGAMK